VTRPDGSPPGPLDWLGFVVVAAGAALAALIECLLVPLYAGSSAVVIPVAVVLAIAGNLVFPRLARILVPGTVSAVVPFGVWLLVMIFFGVMARPEGDVILPGGPGAVEWVTYGTLLGGIAAGVGTILVTTPRPVPPRPLPPRPVSR
jgi:hypothetical protein